MTVPELASDILATVRLVGCVSSKGLKGKGDSLHFDSASQRELGRRYAAQMQALLPGGARQPASPP